MKYNKTWVNLALGIAALIIIGFLLAKFNKPKTSPEENLPSLGQTQSQNLSADKPAAMPSGPYWQGTLKASDNKTKGNYMIEVNGHQIYISTSRDYSSLVGKEVVVTYEGSSDNFVLGDIVQKPQTEAGIVEPK